MTNRSLHYAVVSSSTLRPDQRSTIIALCSEAYGEDLEGYFRDIGPGWHLLATEDDALVAHAMWVARFLEPKGRPRLRTAYVEVVATSPANQGRGIGTMLMQRLAAEIQGFELAALSPADTSLYDRLGWERWRGNLYIRTADGLSSTPDEQVMFLRLPRTPPDLNPRDDLSAEWRPGEAW